MNTYEHLVRKSTPDELAKLIYDMTQESNRYRGAYYAAKAVIEAYTSENPPEDSDVLYIEYIAAGRGL